MQYNSKQDILNAFREMRRLNGYASIWKYHPMGVARDIDNWLLTTLTEFERETVKDVLYLIDSEDDCAKTAGEDTKILSNLKKRIDGHFELEKEKHT